MKKKSIWNIVALSCALVMVASSVAMYSSTDVEKISMSGGEGVISLDAPPFFSVASARDGYAGTPSLEGYENNTTIIGNITVASALIITPSEISVDVKQHQSTAQIITIINIGDKPLQILRIEPDVNWTYVALPPLFSHSLEPQNSTNFIVFADAKNLSGGYHMATLSVKTNVGTENVSINLSVEPWSPIMDVNPNFVLTGMLYGQKSSIKLALTNSGDESLSINVSSDSSWIELDRYTKRDKITFR